MCVRLCILESFGNLSVLYFMDCSVANKTFCSYILYISWCSEFCCLFSAFQVLTCFKLSVECSLYGSGCQKMFSVVAIPYGADDASSVPYIVEVKSCIPYIIQYITKCKTFYRSR